MRFSFSGLTPSPASDGARLSFSLPAPSRVKVEVFDVSGRRVYREDLGSLPGGSHRLAFAGVGRLAPGVYVLRLITEAGELRARATILR